MRDFLIYLVWPNPGNAAYGSPKMQAALVLCAGLIVLSFVLKFWRRSTHNPVSKRLSRSWPTASFWFGLTGLIFIVARVEGIGFLAMRLLWVFWVLSALLYLFFQIRIYRARHYQPLPRELTEDPREKYLPHRKK
ncbi:MAG: hypothetical protein PHS73_04710 [Candidatus Peribacteraceae bacterium]|nr:hypothetical protein [Candidatus Peribacteraceae bacterium]